MIEYSNINKEDGEMISVKRIKILIPVTILMFIIFYIFTVGVNAASCILQINGTTVNTDADPIITNGKIGRAHV